MKHFIFSAILLLSLPAFAKSECQDFIAVPSYQCLNIQGDYDLRFSIMEFQTCEQGKITKLDRLVTLIKVKGSDVLSIPEEAIDVEYESERRYYDRSNRVDDLTFIYPKSATASHEGKTYRLALSNKKMPLSGKFEVLNSQGKIVKTGKLSCDVLR